MKAKKPSSKAKRQPNAFSSIRLIQEELKSRKFFNLLREVGLSDCIYEPHLGDVILTSMKLNSGSDKMNNYFFELIERHSRKVRPFDDSLIKQATEVYEKLQSTKKHGRII